jgi:uncharacterized protein YegL
MPALEVEFAINPQPRCACALILDTSGSMADKIDQLNAGLNVLKDELMRDDNARKRVEIAIVEFNSGVRVVQDFVTVDKFHPPTLTARGTTDLDGGVTQALDLIQRRKRQYASNGIPFYRPWAFLITDAEITECPPVAHRIRAEENTRHLAFFTVGVDGANEDMLRQIGTRPHKMLAGVKFKELFLWLSDSLGRVSVPSVPGDMTPLNTNTGTWERA